jgi:ABC-type Na+ transport system ATPase subunit NatA
MNNIKEVMYKKLSEFSRNTKRALLVAIDFIALPVAFIDDVEEIGLDIHGVKSYM